MVSLILTYDFCFNTFNSFQSKFLVPQVKVGESGWLNLRLLLFLQLVNKVVQAFFMYRRKMIFPAKVRIILQPFFYTPCKLF